MRIDRYIFLFLCFVSPVLNAQDTLDVVKDVSENISLHEKDGVRVVENEEAAHVNRISIHDSLLEKGDLYVFLHQNTFLSVNGRMIKKIDRGGWHMVTDYGFIKDKGNSQISFAFYNKTPFSIDKAIIGRPAVHAPAPRLMKRDPYDTEQHIVAFSFIIVMALLAGLKKQRLTFIQAYFDVRKLLTLTRLDDHIIFNAFSPKSLFIALIAVLALTFTLVINEVHIAVIDRFIPGDASGFIVFGIYITILYPVFIVKFFFLKLLSGIMNLKDAYRLHFFEFVRFWLLISVFYMFLTIFFSTIFNAGNGGFLAALTVFVVFAWLVRLTVMLRRQVKFKNVYFFSYLCASEILPLIVLFKQIQYFV